MRTKVIVNPVSGRGRTGRIWPEIARFIEALGICADYVFTEGHRHAVTLASQAVKQGYERVVAVGGDGTNLEVIEGIAGSDILMGIIPSGTGNDLARSLGVPRDHFKACMLLREPGEGTDSRYTGEYPGRCVRRIDIGKIRNPDSKAGWRHFANIAGIGFDAKIVKEVNDGAKWLKGTSAYLLTALKNLVGYSPVEMEISIDGNTFVREVALVAIGNGKYYGGGMMVTPGAVIDDGLFDICIAGDLTRLELVNMMIRVFSGEHVKHPKVEIVRGRNVLIRSKHEVWCQADGEIIGKAPLEFEVVPGSISVIGSNG